MMRSDPEWGVLGRLARVLAAQALVIVIAGLPTVAVVALADLNALYPAFLRMPLVPERPGASVTAVAEALRQAFPGDEVTLERDAFVITFHANRRDIPRARSIVQSHGFRSTSFEWGRDIRMANLVNVLLEDARGVAVQLLILPIVLLAAATGLRRRLGARPRERPRWSAASIVFAGMGGGLALALVVELLGWVASGLGDPIVEQPLIRAITQSAGAGPLAIFVVAVVVAAPLGEETFYRGWIFPYLAEVAAPLAYVVSALLFAAVHFTRRLSPPTSRSVSALPPCTGGQARSGRRSSRMRPTI
jgi:hypothetical protein